MSGDLVAHLVEYGQYLRAEQRPIAVSEIIVDYSSPRSDEVRSIGREAASRPRRRAAVSAAAAVIVLFVGGLVWLSRSDDQRRIDEPPATTAPATTTPATTTPPTTTPSVTLPVSSPGILGPGAWTVAATFADGEPSEGALTSLIEQVRSWPGVLDVAEVADSAAWRSLTGLDAASCGNSDGAPPCGSGVVVLTVDSSMAQTQIRLQREFGMTAVTPVDVTRAFLDGYLDAAVESSSPVALEFDPSSLGVEQPLSGPFLDYEPEVSIQDCAADPCDVAVEVDVDGVVAQTGVAVTEFRSIVRINMHSVDGLLIDRRGQRGLVASLREVVAHRRVYMFAVLPLEAAVVTFEQGDGSTVWQRPLAGMALIVDSPGSGVGLAPEPPPVGPFVVLDASGAEIMRIKETPDGPLAEDLRVVAAPVETGPLANEPEVAAEVTNVATLEVHSFGIGDFVETGDAVWLHIIDEAERSVVVRIDTASGAVERIPIDGRAGNLVPTADALWVTTTNDRRPVVRIDLKTRTVTDAIEVPVDLKARDIIAADGGLWVTGSTAGYIRIDLTTNAVETYPVDVGAGTAWVGEIDGGLWAYAEIASTGHGQALTRLDLDTGAAERYDIDLGAVPSAAVLAGDSIWLTSFDGLVARFDLESLEITDRLNIGGGLGWGAATFADQAVWIPHAQGTITRIDATTAEVTDAITVGPTPNRMSLFAGSLWVGDADTGVVSRIDIATRQVTDVIAAGSGPLLPVPADGAVWIAAADGTVQRIAVEP